ncbi:MAG: ribonuclease P protein component [Gammaproteobacteria bacterium]|nr:ribonuclease P protein component [Gammaproteobacteria bacterium]
MSSQRFTRHMRLRSEAEFMAVFQRPRRFSDQNLVALCRHNDIHHARLGVSVPKRAFKLASDRNAVKRVIRDSFRRRQVQLDSLDIVIVVKIPSSTFSKRELRECIERLWQKVETQLAGA